MNGNVRFGIFFAIFSGSLVAQGAERLDSNLWYGIAGIVLGLVMVFNAFSKVDKGIAETIRLHDLEKAAKTRR